MALPNSIFQQAGVPAGHSGAGGVISRNMFGKEYAFQVEANPQVAPGMRNIRMQEGDEQDAHKYAFDPSAAPRGEMPLLPGMSGGTFVPRADNWRATDGVPYGHVRAGKTFSASQDGALVVVGDAPPINYRGRPIQADPGAAQAENKTQPVPADTSLSSAGETAKAPGAAKTAGARIHSSKLRPRVRRKPKFKRRSQKETQDMRQTLESTVEEKTPSPSRGDTSDALINQLLERPDLVAKLAARLGAPAVQEVPAPTPAISAPASRQGWQAVPGPEVQPSPAVPSPVPPSPPLPVASSIPVSFNMGSLGMCRSLVMDVDVQGNMLILQVDPRHSYTPPKGAHILISKEGDAPASWPVYSAGLDFQPRGQAYAYQIYLIAEEAQDKPQQKQTAAAEQKTQESLATSSAQAAQISGQKNPGS